MKKGKYFLNTVLIIVIFFMPKTAYTESEFKISFPLGGENPYNIKIESVLDHSGGPIAKDNIVLAYTGDKGMCEEGAKEYKTGKYLSKENKNLKIKCDDKKRNGIWGYMGKDGEKFSITGHCSNDPKENCFLWYDGHAGYDYAKDLNTEIYAAAGGTLCISTSKTMGSKNKKPVMWRDKNKCIYGNDPINGLNKKPTSWDGWHTFYILHEDGYSTWYLHANDLEASVKKDILEKGYSEVYEGQFVAYVGHHGLPGGNHLHFEVRKGNDRNILDPYGWGDYGPMWREAENPEPREPVVISGLKIVENPPYKKGMTITANFEILNKSNEDIEIEIITVGGRDPDDQIADFTWHENFTLQKGETYSYYGFIILEKRGNYHFFIAYKPKNKDWNSSVPVDNESINNILNIYVYPSRPGGEF